MNATTAGHINTLNVLRRLWLNPGISRIEIADNLGLNRSTITHIINELMDNEVVKVLSIGNSAPLGGRKKIQLCINSDYGCVAGLELHAEFVRFVIVNLTGEIVADHTIHIPVNVDNLYDALYQVYGEISVRVKRAKWNLLGIGCGIAGIVDPFSGEVQQSIPLQITKTEPVRAKVEQFMDVPFFIDNDTNCCCWGEIIRKNEPDVSNFMFVLGEWRERSINPSRAIAGIGIGLGINNIVHYGRDFAAGEFRSILWKPNNKSQFSLTNKQIASAKNNRPLFLEMTTELAKNAAMIVNALNLDRLYLGGIFDSSDVDTVKIFSKEIQHNWIYPNKPRCQVVLSSFGERAVAYGAAGMILERIFATSAPQIYNLQEACIGLLLGNKTARGEIPKTRAVG